MQQDSLLPVDVRLYLARNGRAPFERWLEGLKDSVVRARIKARVNRLRLGNFGDSKSVGQGVFELRLDFGPGYRIYFGRASNTVVLLLCGGSKKGQQADIEQAKGYWNDYQNRQETSKE
jgi:putative addiction module killer protein